MIPVFLHLICITLNTELFLFPFYDSLEGLSDIFKVIILENSKKMVCKTASSASELLSLDCFASLQISLTKHRSSKTLILASHE